MPVMKMPPQLPVTLTLRETTTVSNSYENLAANLFEQIESDQKWRSRVALENLTNSLFALRSLSKGWDGDEADAPSEYSVAFTQEILNAMYEHDITPSDIVPSGEGGVATVFIHGTKYAHLEILNSGHLLAVMFEELSKPHVDEYAADSAGVISAIERISAFVS